jgi:hypothetical protein
VDDQSRRLRGRIFAYDQALELGVIEAGILPLVQALSDIGLNPIASCEGHLPYSIRSAYVMFDGPVSPAEPKIQSVARLLKTLVKDRTLTWSWSLTGTFNDELELVYCVRAEPKFSWANWVPIGLTADIKTLSDAISGASNQMKNPHNQCPQIYPALTVGEQYFQKYLSRTIK